MQSKSPPPTKMPSLLEKGGTFFFWKLMASKGHRSVSKPCFTVHAEMCWVLASFMIKPNQIVTLKKKKQVITLIMALSFFSGHFCRSAKNGEGQSRARLMPKQCHPWAPEESSLEEWLRSRFAQPVMEPQASGLHLWYAIFSPSSFWYISKNLSSG